MPLTDAFVRPGEEGTEFVASLGIHHCLDCHTSQTLHDVDTRDYYRDYRYTVSHSAFAQRFMADLAKACFQKLGLKRGDPVIEVGSGDGGQLVHFKTLGAQVLGYEPSADLARASEAAGVPVVTRLFDAAGVRDIPAQFRPAKALLLTYTLDHLPDPLGFLAAARAALDPQDGVLIVEVHDLEKIIDRCETCLFEHEHTIYLHRLTMARLLDRAGFTLINTNLLPEPQRRGNSLLIVASVKGSPRTPDDSARTDHLGHLNEWSTHLAFRDQVQRRLSGLRSHVRGLRAQGQRIAGYGAGGRGVMTLAMTGLSKNDIDYLCDRNPAFHGLLTPQTHVPVVPPEHLDRHSVDELIVFSYGYLAEIRSQFQAFESRGGRIVSMLELLR
jgi:hypothetical protein